MRDSLRTLLPLTLVVAAPWLGWGGSARAEYVAPLALVGRAPTGAFSDGLSRSDLADEASGPIDSSAADRSDNGGKPQNPTYVPDLAGLTPGDGSTGAGSPSPSVNAGSGSSTPLPGVTARPEIDAPALVGTLFLEAVDCQPPPFPSRLFRPPRW